MLHCMRAGPLCALVAPRPVIRIAMSAVLHASTTSQVLSAVAVVIAAGVRIRVESVCRQSILAGTVC